MSRSALAASLVLALGLTLAACSNEPPPPAELTVAMTDFAFEPAAMVLPTGKRVTLTLVNEGMIAHEFMVGRRVVDAQGVPSGYTEDFFAHLTPVVTRVSGPQAEEPPVEAVPEETAGHVDTEPHPHPEGQPDDHDEVAAEAGAEPHGHAHDGFMVLLQPGETVRLSFDVPAEAGEWETGCFEPGHYEAGMAGSVRFV